MTETMRNYMKRAEIQEAIAAAADAQMKYQDARDDWKWGSEDETEMRDRLSSAYDDREHACGRVVEMLLPHLSEEELHYYNEGVAGYSVSGLFPMDKGAKLKLVLDILFPLDDK